MPRRWRGWEVALTDSSQATVMPCVSAVYARFNSSCNGSVPRMVLTPAASLTSQPCQPWRCRPPVPCGGEHLQEQRSRLLAFAPAPLRGPCCCCCCCCELPGLHGVPACSGSREGPKLQNPDSSFPPHLGLCEASTLSGAGADTASASKHPSSALSRLRGLKAFPRHEVSWQMNSGRPVASSELQPGAPCPAEAGESRGALGGQQHQAGEADGCLEGLHPCWASPAHGSGATPARENA